jgi:hypothetical protein
MPLTTAERRAVCQHATCFVAGTFGASPQDRTPTTIVAQMRGAQFQMAAIQGRPLLLPKYGDDWGICDGAIADLALATGCPDRVSYHEMMETLGDGILRYLQEEAHT